MKKVIVLAVFVAFAAGLMFICSDEVFAASAKDKSKTTTAEVKKAEPVKKVEEKKTEESKVICKFKTKDEMQEFEQLYVAKQAMFGRMGVLQAYFTMEQNNLKEIDKQMEKKFDFKMDSNKMYDLNREAMEIREAGKVAQQPVQQ